MATDDASESLPDTLSSLTRVDVWANRLRMSVDILLGRLRSQGIYLNPGDRIPERMLFDALQAELDAGRPWAVEQLTWH